jgi:hypothetical protein
MVSSERKWAYCDLSKSVKARNEVESIAQAFISSSANSAWVAKAAEMCDFGRDDRAPT